MIAMGILAIGLSMVATAFPVALVENKESFDATMATLITQNGLSVCRARLGHNELSGTCSTLTEVTGKIGAFDQAYPIGDPALTKTRYGFLVAVRQLGNGDYYQVALVAYRKFKVTDTLSLTGCTIASNGATASGANMLIGSPVINKATGEYAYVIKADGTLSRSLPNGDALTLSGPTAGGLSPAIGCYVTQTCFAPQR